MTIYQATKLRKLEHHNCGEPEMFEVFGRENSNSPELSLGVISYGDLYLRDDDTECATLEDGDFVDLLVGMTETISARELQL